MLFFLQHANFIEYGRKGPRRSQHSEPDPFAEELFGSNSQMKNLTQVSFQDGVNALDWLLLLIAL